MVEKFKGHVKGRCMKKALEGSLDVQRWDGGIIKYFAHFFRGVPEKKKQKKTGTSSIGIEYKIHGMIINFRIM